MSCVPSERLDPSAGFVSAFEQLQMDGAALLVAVHRKMRVFGWFLLVDIIASYRRCECQHIYKNSVRKVPFYIVAIDIMFPGIYPCDASTQTEFDIYFHGCGILRQLTEGVF